MNLLLNLLNGGTKHVVSTIGNNRIFYGSCLKVLKWSFEISYVVAHLKLRVILYLPQISIDGSNGLRKLNQQLEGTITWLCSIGYIPSLELTENVSKAVVRVSKLFRTSFNKISRIRV